MRLAFALTHPHVHDHLSSTQRCLFAVHTVAVLTCALRGGGDPPAPMQQGRKRNISDTMGQIIMVMLKLLSPSCLLCIILLSYGVTDHDATLCSMISELREALPKDLASCVSFCCMVSLIMMPYIAA